MPFGLSFHKQVWCLSIFPQQFTYYLLFLNPPSLLQSLSLSPNAGNCRLSRISSRGNINYLSASIFLPNSYLKGKQKRAEVREIFFKLFISSSPSATVFSSCRMLCTARTANKGICHAFKNKREAKKRGNNQIFETLLIYSDTLYVLLSFVLSTCLKRTAVFFFFLFPPLRVIKCHECLIFQGLYWPIFVLLFIVCIIDSHHLSHLEHGFGGLVFTCLLNLII